MTEEMKFGAIEAQREYVQSRVKGYGFTNHNKWWHWLYEIDQINPEDRARLEKEWPNNKYFIWSLNTYTNGPVIITPCHSLLDWTEEARKVAQRNGGEG